MFNTAYNYDFSEARNFEPASKMPHETIPEQAYTIDELLKRFASNNLPDIQKNPIYENEPTFDSYDVTLDPAFDLSDYTLHSNSLRANRVPSPDTQDTSTPPAPPAQPLKEQNEDVPTSE